MKLSKNCKYAVRIIAYLAKNTNTRIVQTREIAEKEGISKYVVDQIANRLKRKGIIKSFRGCSGGYILAKPAKTISIGDIVRAIDGQIRFVECCKNNERCRRADFCKPHKMWIRINSDFEKFLDKVKIGAIL